MTAAQDKLDAAIAAAEKPALVRVSMRKFDITLMADPARPATFAMPEDVTDLEILNLIANVLAAGDQLRSHRPAQIVVARQIPAKES